MSQTDDADRLRKELVETLGEDAHNTERLLARLDAVMRENDVGPYSGLLLILTRLVFEEEQARQHWDAIQAHRRELGRGLGREAGVRTALLDYFVNVNRKLVRPTLVDLELLDPEPAETGRDGRTSLATDRRFRSTLQRELRRARRYGQKMSVILVDADGFAAINERCGAIAGDRLLRDLAELLGKSVRDIDLAARAAEDSFAVLLPETDRNAALLVAERFRRRVETEFAGRAAALTVSAGVACFPDDATTPEGVLDAAARALHGAKAAGRNAVRPYHPERRRYLRFDLEPGRFEVEVLSPPERESARGLNLSRNGILFTCAERLEVGEQIEIRLAQEASPPSVRALRVRGSVVRLEELPPGSGSADSDERYEVGVAFDFDWAEGADDLLEFLERAQAGKVGRRP